MPASHVAILSRVKTLSPSKNAMSTAFWSLNLLTYSLPRLFQVGISPLLAYVSPSTRIPSIVRHMIRIPANSILCNITSFSCLLLLVYTCSMYRETKCLRFSTILQPVLVDLAETSVKLKTLLETAAFSLSLTLFAFLALQLSHV